MQVKLVRRWGPYRAGRSVDVGETQARWLIQHHYAESTGDVRAPEQEPASSGAAGADPLAGADATRRRPRTFRSDRDKEPGVLREAPGSSPAYRAGFTAEARERQGEAGREQRDATASTSAATSEESTASATSTESGDESAGADTKRPARRRSKSES